MPASHDHGGYEPPPRYQITIARLSLATAVIGLITVLLERFT